MEYRSLGRSGLKVSPLCLGAMMFGDQTDATAAHAIIARAQDAGINFIDTADAYAQGRSEQIVGQAIQSARDRWVLATKVGYPTGDSTIPSGADLSRKYLMRAIDQSLQRLATDYIDIWYLHRDDAGTPLAETLHALRDLVGQGKIRHFGISNFRAWRLAEVVRLCDELGMDRPVACQPQYNAMNRMPESELLPACEYFGIGVVPYSPLARGVLTGKYAGMDQFPAGSRAARQDRRLLQTELRPESLELAQRIREHAQARGSTASHFAVRWVLNNRIVTSVIGGPRTMEQWEDYLAALEAPFSAEDEALVDQLVPPGHPSTHGFTDPNYPVTGRAPRTAATR